MSSCSIFAHQKVQYINVYKMVNSFPDKFLNILILRMCCHYEWPNVCHWNTLCYTSVRKWLLYLRNYYRCLEYSHLQNNIIYCRFQMFRPVRQCCESEIIQFRLRLHFFPIFGSGSIQFSLFWLRLRLQFMLPIKKGKKFELQLKNCTVKIIP